MITVYCATTFSRCFDHSRLDWCLDPFCDEIYWIAGQVLSQKARIFLWVLSQFIQLEIEHEIINGLPIATCQNQSALWNSWTLPLNYFWFDKPRKHELRHLDFPIWKNMFLAMGTSLKAGEFPWWKQPGLWALAVLSLITTPEEAALMLKNSTRLIKDVTGGGEGGIL